MTKITYKDYQGNSKTIEVDNGIDEENHGFDEGDNIDVHNENDGPDHGVDKDTLLLSIC